MNQCYFNGDFYQCATATLAGESPTSAAAKWRKVLIPKEFRRVLARLTYAGLLEIDGQNDKAKIEKDRGQSWLDDLTRKSANRELDRTTPSPASGYVAASVILEDAYRLMRWDTETLDDSEKGDARTALSSALQQVWDEWWWPELMTFDQEQLRPSYDATTIYQPGTEVFFPADGGYYQAVQLCKNLPPATLIGGEYVLNAKFWQKAQPVLSGEDYVSGSTYEWGTIVRNPDDGLHYSRSGSFYVTDINALFTSGPFNILDFYPTAGFVPANELAWATGTVSIAGGGLSGDGGLMWAIDPGRVDSDGVAWLISKVVGGTLFGQAEYWTGPDDFPHDPTQATAWGNYVLIWPDQSGPDLVTFSAGVAPAPPTTTSWGLMAAFDPALSYARTVRSVSRLDPRTTTAPHAYAFDRTASGIRVPCWRAGTAWIWARRATPVLTGNDFDSATTYEATHSEDLVFDT